MRMLWNIQYTLSFLGNKNLQSKQKFLKCKRFTRILFFVPTGSFSKVVLSHGAVNHVILGVFLMFSAFFYSKLWAKFYFGTFEPYDYEKSWKISSFKKVRFQGWLKMASFLLTEFQGLPSLGSIIFDISPSVLQILVLVLLQISWIFRNSPNILNLYDFEGFYGKKNKNMEIRKYANLSQPWNLAFFENEIFNFWLRKQPNKS